MFLRAAVAVVVGCFVGAVATQTSAAQPSGSVEFHRDIQPLLNAHCMKCHGLEGREATLDLRSAKLIRQGGDSGAAIEPGSANHSLLFAKIADRTMPPKGELPLSKEAIDLIRRWIDEGASAQQSVVNSEIEVSDGDREHWAFRRARRPTIPPVQQPQLARTPVDRFLLAKLEQKSLAFSPEAEPSAIVRRLFLDLIGLPPSPDEVAAFVEHSSPLAYERTVDRLLASPHFGQRWGRHWLDAAGYVDTIGDDTDATIAKVAKGKWRYRDYVVDSLNADKPFDRFILEQIAGDELVDWRSAERFTPEIRELLIATTFLRSAADETLQTELNTADIRHEVLQRTMEVTVNNLLGLTIKCARCHDHKYDPLPQEDYYRLLACFTPAFDPQAWLQPGKRALPDVSPSKHQRFAKRNAEIDNEIADRNKQIQSLRKPYRERMFAEKLAMLPEAVRADTKEALETPQEKRTKVQAYLAEKFGTSLEVSDASVDAGFSDNDRNKVNAILRQINELNAQRHAWGTIQAVYDIGPAPATYLLARGNHERPSYEVIAGSPQVLNPSKADAKLQPASLVHSTGRRLALARWLTDPNQPAAALMARVLVNRVWQQFFGRGIVETTDNFGYSGASPTHPQLLEWLAAEFIESGWSYKHLIKLIVTSSAYRQASTLHAYRRSPTAKTQLDGEPVSDTTCRSDHPEGVDPRAIDPGNLLLWKMPLRQLESEIIRDSILAVSGELNLTFGGPSLSTISREDGFVVIDEAKLPNPSGKYRRSLYILGRRRYHESFLDSFGQPEMTTNCTKRIPSAVVGQSLALMNDAFLFEQSSRFADRVIAQSDVQTEERAIELAFEIALSRAPSSNEHQWASQFLAEQARRYRQDSTAAQDATKHALRHLCHMLLCTNEFLYVP